MEELRKKRDSIQETLGRQAIHCLALEDLAIKDIDQEQVERLRAKLDADDTKYVACHNELTEEDEDLVDDNHATNLEIHNKMIQTMRQQLRSLSNRAQAAELLDHSEILLQDLEEAADDGYRSRLDDEMKELAECLSNLRKARSRPGVSSCVEISKQVTTIINRHRKLQDIQESSRDAKEAEISKREVKPVITTQRQGLTTDVPSFDGNVLSWRLWWKTFLTIMSENPHLSQHAQQCQFLKAMADEDCHEYVKDIFDQEATYEDAIKRIRERFEDKKALHLYHHREFFRQKSLENTRAELQAFSSQTKRAQRGFKDNQADTLSQAMTMHGQTIMSPQLLTLWKRNTKKLTTTPPVEDLLHFLDEQIKILGADEIEPLRETTRNPTQGSLHKPDKKVFKMQKVWKCAYCKEEHSTFACSEFKEMPVSQRRSWARDQHRCFNCLSEGHRAEACKSNRSCQTCQKTHHSLLHQGDGLSSSDSPKPPLQLTCTTKVDSSAVIPVTAMATVTSGGSKRQARMLLDTGAEVTVISKKLAATLTSPRRPGGAITLAGIGQVRSLYSMPLHLYGDKRVGKADQRIMVTAHVLNKVPQPNLENVKAKFHSLPFIANSPMADSEPQSSRPIDIILDLQAYYASRLGSVLMAPEQGLIADKTIFGWVLGGSALKEGIRHESQPKCYSVSQSEPQLEELLERQWRMDQQAEGELGLTIEETKAHQHFDDTHRRQSDGRYEVELPRVDDPPQLGESRERAAQRYRSVEKAMRRKGTWEAYKASIQDFLDRGHAEPVPTEDLHKPAHQVYYMPMHGVEKTTSTTTKIRPVCDASAATSTGVSLNDVVLAGPSLFQPLPTIINRFRESAVAMTADVSKMYRQIALAEKERDFHRFLFCRSGGGSLKEFRMTTLTFGVKSSPYVASRVLQQIAIDEEEDHPKAAEIIRNSFYMDDVLTGADSVEDAQLKREDLNEILRKGGMPLCKWRSNSAELLLSIPEKLVETTDLQITASPAECQKALGLHWATKEDALFAATPSVEKRSTVNKRQLASVAAKIFDPLGWFAPAVIPARLLTQEAWQLKAGWDESLPEDMHQKYEQWTNEMPVITKHPIPRHLGSSNKTILRRELHGFSDASTVGFGGVVYLRTVYHDLDTVIHLITAKARLAPLRTISVPRLELSGAVVLARLLAATAKDLRIEPSSMYAWTDSTVVLGWLRHSPSKLAVFVGNRVSKIAQLTPTDQWRHVPGKINPADCLSRGLNPEALVKFDLWWHGPEWLQQEPAQWPHQPEEDNMDDLPEMKQVALPTFLPPPEIGDKADRYTRWIRVMAWVWKFARHSSKRANRPDLRELTLDDLTIAKTKALLATQLRWLGPEYETIQQGKPLPRRHPLRKLSPFIGTDRLLRVGGRLSEADLPETAIHPIILSAKSTVVRIMVEHFHRVLFHPGAATVMATIAYSFHIVRLRPLLRGISRRCLECQVKFARPTIQQMGDLPRVRVTPAQVFANVGVDYAGPVYSSQGRGSHYQRIKKYFCIFVCMATKAVHIEVADDCTTETFLAALNRFSLRRGLPGNVYSDHGGNFIGAEAELKIATELLRSDESKAAIREWCFTRNVQWHFIPARAPNFGGLWEAAVKSIKGLIRRNLGTQNCTYGELATLAAAAEATLNSRPYLPIYSTDEEALCPLTPGHFLIGRPLRSLPQQVDLTSRISNIRRWKLVKHLEYTWWQQWKKQYLPSLIQRAKNMTPQTNFEVGDFVLVTKTDTVRFDWPLGVVISIFPGPDELVRVAEVKIGEHQTVTRPICKLVKLPKDGDFTSGGECWNPEDGAEEEEGVLGMGVPGEEADAAAVEH